jgi:hypothetical protein
VQLGTSVAVRDRGDPVARTGELEASARDLLAVVELRRRSQPQRTRAGGPLPQALRHAGQYEADVSERDQPPHAASPARDRVPAGPERRRCRVRIVFAPTGAIREDPSAEHRANQAYRSGRVSQSRKAERSPFSSLIRSIHSGESDRARSRRPRPVRTLGTSPLQSWAVRRGRERMRSSAKARLPRCGNQASRPRAMSWERSRTLATCDRALPRGHGTLLDHASSGHGGSAACDPREAS